MVLVELLLVARPLLVELRLVALCCSEPRVDDVVEAVRDLVVGARCQRYERRLRVAAEYSQWRPC